MIYFTSDLHFCHDRDFLWQPRGFNSVYEMNDAIVKNWNEIVNIDDDVYVLGDLMLNDNETGIKLLKSLKGKIHIILGNHDTLVRKELYKNCYNVVEVCYATVVKYNKYRFYLSHYPTLTANFEEKGVRPLVNLFGHTHSSNKFYMENPYMYNVACDAHNCTPVAIEKIIEDITMKVKEIK